MMGGGRGEMDILLRGGKRRWSWKEGREGGVLLGYGGWRVVKKGEVGKREREGDMKWV